MNSIWGNPLHYKMKRSYEKEKDNMDQQLSLVAALIAVVLSGVRETGHRKLFWRLRSHIMDILPMQ